jgi:hypothetical protein
MDSLLFVILVSALTGFVAGVLGNYCYQRHQRVADQKRWAQIKDEHISSCVCSECQKSE